MWRAEKEHIGALNYWGWGPKLNEASNLKRETSDLSSYHDVSYILILNINKYIHKLLAQPKKSACDIVYKCGISVTLLHYSLDFG